MKKYFISLILIFTSLITVAQDYRGTPIVGVKTIERVIDNSQKKSFNLEKEIADQTVLAARTAGTPTGNSSQVGVTEGQLSVSLSGAANYSIPIAVPPGINGVVPQISLAYNSQSGNGIAGYGWNISGISAITRIPSTQFHDGVIDPVDFDGLDRFAFDGQRLILKDQSQIYGAPSTVYETENFSNVKITAIGGTNNNPDSFTVEYPDGSVAEYGINYTKTITTWGISFWKNPQNIQIYYYYDPANNILTPTAIRYGGVLNIGMNNIFFNYDNRSRAEQSFNGGQSIISSKILKSIKINVNTDGSIFGTGFRNYYLEYDTTSLGYQRLLKVTEKCGDDSLNYNPTVFSYNTTNNTGIFTQNTPATLSVGPVDYNNGGSVSGLFDEDSKFDLILFPKTGNDAFKKFYFFNQIYSNGTNIGYEAPWPSSFKDIFATNFLSLNASGEYKLTPYQGFTVVEENSSNNSFKFSVCAKTTFGISTMYNKIVNFPTVSSSTGGCDNNCNALNYSEINIPKKILSGDFNGDGLTDVMAIDISAGTYIYGACYEYTDYETGQTYCNQNQYPYSSNNVYFVDLKRDVTSSHTALGALQNLISTDTNVQVIDFNGDGKSDFMVIYSGYVKVYGLNHNNTALILLAEHTEIGIKTDKPILMGDYNGDGKTDFCIPQEPNQDSWNFYFATGSGFHGLNTAIGLPFYESNLGAYGIVGFPLSTYSFNDKSYIANDFNGDGKTDILFQQNLTVNYFWNNDNDPDYSLYGTPQLTYLNLYENRSCNGTSINFNNVSGRVELGNVRRFPIPVYTNHNQVNLNLEYSLVSDNKIFSFKSPKDNKVDVLLRNITTGNGVTESITYQGLRDYPCTTPWGCNQVYSNSGYTDNYPNTDIVLAPTFNVVSQLQKQSLSVNKFQKFNYYGAVSNLEGLGFLGFRALLRTNWFETDSQIISTITKNDISLRGAPVESFTVLGATYVNQATPTTNFISKSKNVYNKHFKLNQFNPVLLPNKVFKLYLTDSESFNGLENTKSTTKTRYNGFNNPFTSTINLYNGTVLEQTTGSSVVYENNTGSGTYIVGRPLSKNTSVIIYPNIAAKRDETKSEEIYTYNNNLLSEVKKRSTNSGQTSDYLTEQNDYDTYGNITQKRILATGLTTRTTNYQYEPAYPFNGRFLTKSIDIESLATEFIYNPSNGLLISEKNPYNLTTSYEYDKWFKKTKVTDYLGKSKNFFYSRIPYGTESTFSTSSDDCIGFNYSIYDDLGRKVAEIGFDLNNNYSNINYEYDIYDRNYKTSEPYFSNTVPTQWNETFYDSYGRPIRSDSFTGKFVTIDYAGLTTTVSENVTLPTPLIVKSKASIKNAMGNVIAMTETLGGVPGGTLNYTYFANGNLKTTTFGGTTTTITQDGWGRKKQLDDPSAGTYQYTYNDFGETLTETVRAAGTTTAPGPGAIKGITTYTINGVGKVSEKTIVGQNGDTTNSKTTYTYDTTDKLLKTMRFDDYTAGTFTNYTYGYDAFKRPNFNDESGFQAYYQRAKQYDAFGRVEKELFSATNTSDSKASHKWIRYTYKNGYQFQIIDDATNKVLREIKTVNARGQMTQALNGYTTESHIYNASGLQTNANYMNLAGPNNSVSGTAFLSLNTNFDNQRGNLLSRNNPFTTYQENFTYDLQDRLLTYPNETNVIQTQSYDVAGKITANNIGDYAYTNTTKPYQLTSITPIDQTATSSVLNYYTNRNQDIKYNVFKSPVSIMEQGKENIFFEYNAFNQRSTMYYGGLQTDKNLLPWRKFYNADGTMEIKRSLSGGVEFTTYIGGDAYSAPLMLKSNGITQSYLYLCRDYQSSIIAVTDVDGLLLNKRFYDAWGKLSHNETRACPIASCPMQASMPTATGNLAYTDRGYTGHEMLLGVGLINMNARLYDPKLHRFLAPDNFVQDPSNTQNYNRYGYCYNNPLKYSDPSGEWFWMAFAVGAIIGAVAGGASYAAQAIQTGNWSWGQFGISVLGGALVGGISGGYASMACSVTTSAVVNAFATGMIAGMMPVYGVQVGDWSFSISPSIAFGTGGASVGLVGSVGYNDGKKWSFSINATARVKASTIGGGFSYSDGKNSYSAGFTHFGGKDSQNNWMVGYSSGDFSFKMTNDAFVGGDKARTAAAEIGIGNYSYGFSLYTTAPPKTEYDNGEGQNKEYNSPIWGKNPYNTYSSGSRVFAGMYIGVRRGNHIQRLGYDGAAVQDLFQNGIHRNVVTGPYLNTNLGSLPGLFQQNFTNNPWTLYSN